MNRQTATIVVVSLILAAGCAGTVSPTKNSTSTTPNTETTPTPIPQTNVASSTTTPTITPSTVDTPTPSQPPALDPQLYQLVIADNRSDYAEQQGLAYRNGSVQAVIELETDASLPEGFAVVVELRHDRLIQGYVPVESLVPLANHGNVSAVRPPNEPQPT